MRVTILIILIVCLVSVSLIDIDISKSKNHDIEVSRELMKLHDKIKNNEFITTDDLEVLNKIGYPTNSMIEQQWQLTVEVFQLSQEIKKLKESLNN